MRLARGAEQGAGPGDDGDDLAPPAEPDAAPGLGAVRCLDGADDRGDPHCCGGGRALFREPAVEGFALVFGYGRVPISSHSHHSIVRH